MARARAAGRRADPAAVIIPLLVGAGVAVVLGVYGQAHDPTGRALFTMFFTATINLKVWFATLSLLFGVFQLLSALRLYGKIKIPRDMPSWLGQAHRLSGTLAFLVSLPVAYHCLWGLGFATEGGSRRVWHSIFGCAFYGAFAAKVLIVRSRRMPNWALPVVGGLTFAVLVLVWYTSALWYFTNTGFEV